MESTNNQTVETIEVVQKEPEVTEPVASSAEEKKKTPNESPSKAGISELASLQKPPQMVKEVFEAVTILLKGEKQDWTNTKKMIGSNQNFVNTLQNFDKENIKPDTLEKLKPYVENPEFTPEKVKAKVAACAWFAQWVIDIYVHATNSPIVHREKESVTPEAVIEPPKSPRKEKRAKTPTLASSVSSNFPDLPAPLHKLDKKLVNELKGLHNPPSLVVQTVDAVTILLKGDRQDWKDSKIFLGNYQNFMASLAAFDKDHVKPETLEKLKPYVENPDFTVERVNSVSPVCTALVQWVLDIYTHASNSPIVHREKEPSNTEQAVNEPKSPRVPKTAPVKSKEPTRLNSGNVLRRSRHSESVDEVAQLKDMVIKLTQSLLIKDEEIQQLRKLVDGKDQVASTESIQIDA